jgi:hypothetical protein
MTEAELHAAIGRAWREGRVDIEVAPPQPWAWDTPGLRPTDFGLPPLLIAALSIYFVFVDWLLLGIGSFAILVLVCLTFPLWNRERAIERVRTAALAKVRDWQLLWERAAITLRLIGKESAVCQAPEGDWQTFARRYLLDLRTPASTAASELAR